MISRPAGWDLLRPHPVWLQANSIIDGIAKPLLTAQVAFCRLDRNVSQQELNLLQFTASLMAQTGACASEIVRRESTESHSLLLSPSRRPR